GGGGRAGAGAGGQGGVPRQAARGAGGRGAGACPGGRGHHLGAGGAGPGGVSGTGSQEPSPRVSSRPVEMAFVFDRHVATDLSVAYSILVPQRRARPGRGGPGGKKTPHPRRGRLPRGGPPARPRAGQPGREPQPAALREHAARNGLEVPAEWVFEDAGHSGAALVRPALERLRDLAAQGCVDVVLVYSPDRLARKFAYQALLIEEFSRAGARVEF